MNNKWKDKCFVCGSEEILPYSRAGRFYKLKKCNNCQLVFDTVTFSKFRTLYSKNYYISQKIKGGYFNYFEESFVNRLTFQYRLYKIIKLLGKKNIKLLDIGCALGDFLEVARSLRFSNVVGTEISDFAINECKKKGLKVYRDNSHLMKTLEPSSFDVITLQDVIEHLPNPEEKLLQIYNLLKPGGILFITCPNLDSFSEKILRRYWYHYKKGEHVFYFNKKNIKILLKKVNFRILKVNTALSFVNLKYILGRFSYYFPFFSKPFIKRFFNNSIFLLTFPVSAGEMEIFAKKI